MWRRAVGAVEIDVGPTGRDGMAVMVGSRVAQVAPPVVHDGAVSWAAVIVIGLGLLGIVVVVAKTSDVWRRRRRERAALRGAVTDALMRNAGLAGLQLVPRVRVPFWTGTPATLVVSGPVRNADERALAMTTAREAAREVRSDVEVHDRMTVAARERRRGAA